MPIVFSRVECLPRLAWCARLERATREVVVRHGPWVETGETWFCEGAWNGDFPAADFVDSTAFVGSGGSLYEQGVVFASATHTLERLHLLRQGDRVIVSNSLPFLLAEAGDRCDERYLFYSIDLQSIVKGIRRCVQRIPTRGGNRVRLVYHANVLVRWDLGVEIREKVNPPAPASYDDYVSFLATTVEEVTRNAGHPQRRIRYRPLTTLSSGYDSPACAVLARASGCREAVTFARARPAFRERNDSGAPIAAWLGVSVRTYERETYCESEDFPEVEFLACGTGGDDVVMWPLADVLEGRLLLTGFHGDAVWGRGAEEPDTDIRRADPSGASLAEFRLRLGFLHLPLPFVGCRNYPAIRRISESGEMQPWSVGGPYDKPIARRIVEAAGVPRELFGQHKKAITQSFRHDLEQSMTARSYADFAAFVRSVPLTRAWHRRAAFGFMRLLYEANLRLVWRAARIRRFVPWVRLREPLIPERFAGPVDVTALTFHWAMNKITPRYLAGSGAADAERVDTSGAVS